MLVAAVAAVTEEQRAYLRSNPARWWFSDDDLNNYRYLTCVTDDHEAIFRIAARVDIAALVEAQWCLARAADIIVAAEEASFLAELNNKRSGFTFTPEAGLRIKSIPTPFHGAALNEIFRVAKDRGATVIDDAVLDIVQAQM